MMPEKGERSQMGDILSEEFKNYAKREHRM